MRRSRPRARLPRRPSAPISQRRKVGCLDAAQVRTERRVGRVEQVMALVEHVAQRARRVVRPPIAAWIITSAWLR